MGFHDLLSNPLLVSPLLAWTLAQVVKTLIFSVENGRFEWSRLFGDGGMPSGHSATVTALATSSALKFGLGSEVFAMSAILAVIVMHDAMSVRLESGKQARLLNEVVELLKSKSVLLDAKKLKELLGHTPLQVFFGALLGLVVSLMVGV